MYTLVNAAVKEHRDYGNHCLEYIGNVRSAIADFWSAYEQIIPKSRHRAVGKNSGRTNLIERFNCT